MIDAVALRPQGNRPGQAAGQTLAGHAGSLASHAGQTLAGHAGSDRGSARAEARGRSMGVSP